MNVFFGFQPMQLQIVFNREKKVFNIFENEKYKTRTIAAPTVRRAFATKPEKQKMLYKNIGIHFLFMSNSKNKFMFQKCLVNKKTLQYKKCFRQKKSQKYHMIDTKNDLKTHIFSDFL